MNNRTFIIYIPNEQFHTLDLSTLQQIREQQQAYELISQVKKNCFPLFKPFIRTAVQLGFIQFNDSARPITSRVPIQ